ncbi:MalY/PatB family protein [Candidatus Azobacteroides pseudotrichonymphae]|uniref:cysteine-S-conjugate beta-lyase n=1 Tax=Azobacteroides pseudotrichonymphae genomovar. CFP2 TaxID=511995 RepID=B6YRU7_AZOPC|nr:PatB family C-S lyase [Candidatus Azobacteroides pseudotrichonymphae]BAG83919.1 putative aminotransferase B [Candidatus Azobacteroides pseudotrichonymphae genomovar. CFP2]
MVQYNFDEKIERKGTGALKTDALQERFGKTDLISLWVADMDFRCGDFIIDALIDCCKQGIFGYTIFPEKYFLSVKDWILEHHHWLIEREWFSFIPGVMKGIAFAIINFTNPKDKVIIQPPVYYPFRLVTQMHNRQVVNNPLIEEDGKYRMDLDGLRKIIDKNCRLLILSNPHNPIGISWKQEILEELAEICFEKNILVISDEIHSDMAIFGHRHTPFALVSKHAEQNSITFMAPTKTFNLAGIVSSYAIVLNKEVRNIFYSFLRACGLDEGTIFSYSATQAAYVNGSEWKRQMLQYIENNIRIVDSFLKKYIPIVKMFMPEASFLVWLDCRELRLSQKELNNLFIEKANLALNDGEVFGKEGIGFMRMNVGCPQSILIEALNNLKNALKSG